jgi:hypothetical protein
MKEIIPRSLRSHMTSVCFDVEMACKYGIIAAIVYARISECIGHIVRTKGNADQDGIAWLYESADHMCELIPYIPTEHMNSAIRLLILEGLLISKSTLHAGQMHVFYSLGEPAWDWTGALEHARSSPEISIAS